MVTVTSLFLLQFLENNWEKEEALDKLTTDTIKTTVSKDPTDSGVSANL